MHIVCTSLCWLTTLLSLSDCLLKDDRGKWSNAADDPSIRDQLAMIDIPCQSGGAACGKRTLPKPRNVTAMAYGVQRSRANLGSAIHLVLQWGIAEG